jgi:hypothetical protein
MYRFAMVQHLIHCHCLCCVVAKHHHPNGVADQDCIYACSIDMQGGWIVIRRDHSDSFAMALFVLQLHS